MKEHSNFRTQFNFFEAQANKKKLSVFLIFIFILFIFLTGLVLTLLTSGFLIIFLPFILSPETYINFIHSLYGYPPKLLALQPFLLIFFTFGFISFMVVYKNYKNLKKYGGLHIAETLQATVIYKYKGEAETKAKRFLNVVEEVSIAAGFPMPLVYILPGRGINAMVAGFSYNDAVLIVTEGALLYLNRDELTGVIGHEFGHIINGDMYYKLMSTAWLMGFLFLSLIGNTALLGIFGFNKDNYEKNKSLKPLHWFSSYVAPFLPYLFFPFFFMVFIIGFVGEVFAIIIQSAFNRQREYLADACSVQFTRNPLSLASALKKIKSSDLKGQVYAPQALAIRHLFIVNPTYLGHIFQTHPPIEKRIANLDPHWDEDEINKRPHNSVKLKDSEKKLTKNNSVNPAFIFASSFFMAETNNNYSLEIKKYLPEEVKIMAKNNLIATICALIMFHDIKNVQLCDKQLAIIEEMFNANTMRSTINNLRYLEGMKSDFLLAILDIIAADIRMLNNETKLKISNLTFQLLKISGKIDLYKMAIMHILNKLLDFKADKFIEPLDFKKNKKEITESVLIIYNLLAKKGNEKNLEMATKSFLEGLKYLNNMNNLNLIDFKHNNNIKINMASLNKAFSIIERCDLEFKKNVLVGAIKIALYDYEIIPKENELLRALAASIGLSLMGLDIEN